MKRIVKLEEHMRSIALAAAAVAALAAAIPSSRVLADGTLPQVGRTTARKFVAEAQKPVVLLVVTENCAPCQTDEALLSGAANKHPEFKFVKIDARDAGMPVELAPAVVVLSQGWVRSYEAVRFQPDGQGVELFLQGRSAYFAARTQAQQKIADSKTILEAKQKPFKDKIDGIGVEMNQVNRPEIDTYDSDSHALAAAVNQHGMNSAEADVARKKLWADDAVLNEKNKPFFARIQEVQSQMEAACAQEQANLKAAEDALKALDNAEWAAGGPKE
jgi:thiol-disulfide isomerase/thioredoxin